MKTGPKTNKKEEPDFFWENGLMVFTENLIQFLPYGRPDGILKKRIRTILAPRIDHQRNFFMNSRAAIAGES